MFILAISSNAARNIFTVVFTVLLAGIAFFSKACYEACVQMSLLKGHDLSLIQALGWLRGSSVLTAWPKTRTFPGGWWYAAMVFTGLASYATQFFINAITSTSIVTTCPFDQGMIVQYGTIGRNPSPNEAGFDLALTSQRNVLNNPKCQVGIYNKVPDDVQLLTNICPQRQNTANGRSDVLGAWSCRSAANVTWSGRETPDSVRDKGVHAGYLFDNSAMSWFDDTEGNTTVYSGIMVWSSPAALDETDVDWTVKFGMAAKAIYADEPRVYNFYDCSVEHYETGAPERLDNIIQAINTTKMISDWSTGLQRYLYRGQGSDAREDSAVQMALLLNSIVMVSGSGGRVQDTVASDLDQTYGCLQENASVLPIFVLAYAGACATVCLSFMLWYAVLKLQLRPLLKGRGYVESVPTDMSTWAAMAAQFSVRGQNTAAAHVAKNEMTKLKWTRESLRCHRVRLDGDQLSIFETDGARDVQEPDHDHEEKDLDIITVAIPKQMQ